MSATTPQNPNPSDATGANLAWALFVCRSVAVSVEVFLHREIGERYLGLPAAAVLLLVPLYSLGWRGHDLWPLMLFLLAYLVMCCCARVGSLVRRFRGEPGHSFYTGWPRVMTARAKWSEVTFKRFVEPLLVLSFGFLILLANPPLGTYLMLAAGGLFISVNASIAEERTRALDMNDAVIHQEIVAERFRGMRGERW
jgi:hypothetical protein